MLVLPRVISRNLKSGGGGIDNCLGDVNMREAQIYITKNWKTEIITLSWRGGGSFLTGWGGLYPPHAPPRGV